MIAFALCGAGASAEPMSGRDILRLCQPTEDRGNVGICLGFVRGTVEGMMYGAVAGASAQSGGPLAEPHAAAMLTTVGMCPAADVSLARMRDVFVIAMKSAPGDQALLAVFLLHRALNAAWPCA